MSRLGVHRVQGWSRLACSLQVICQLPHRRGVWPVAGRPHRGRGRHNVWSQGRCSWDAEQRHGRRCWRCCWHCGGRCYCCCGGLLATPAPPACPGAHQWKGDRRPLRTGAHGHKKVHTRRLQLLSIDRMLSRLHMPGKKPTFLEAAVTLGRLAGASSSTPCTGMPHCMLSADVQCSAGILF